MTPLVRLVIRLVLVLTAGLLLHTAIFPQLRLLDVGADVLLLFAIAAGIVAGPDKGAIVGFTVGLLADCFLQTPFGLSALVYCLVGWGVGSFQTTILHATWWIPVATAMVASAAGVLLYVGLGVVVGQDQLLSWHVVEIAGVVALLNGLLCHGATSVLRWSLMVDDRAQMALR